MLFIVLGISYLVKQMHNEIQQYAGGFSTEEQAICLFLQGEFNRLLPQAELKIWHAHPVWFVDGNPVAGYSRLKGGIRVLFWSGQSFSTPGLLPEGKFKAAEVRLTSLEASRQLPWSAWCQEALAKQWDYKNIVKRKGQLLPLTTWED